MMPLVERDVNTQPDISRLNRHSAHSELPYRRMNDENSPLPRQARSKVRQPSRRLLAPTRASTAKNTSPRTPVHQSPQSHTSKLPRRTPAANADASALKVSAASAVKETPFAPSANKPLPGEKALPPRPIASLAALSPSKGRTLIDASEQLLSHHDWPTLTPRSSSAPPTEMPAQEQSERPQESPNRLSDSGTSFMATPAELTRSVNGKLHTDSIDHFPMPFATTAASLENVVSGETPSALHPVGTPLDPPVHRQSRIHSPSPASFSRPRPGSISRGTSSPSLALRPAMANSARAIKSEKTASRIPIPDPKKAVLVEVKGRQAPSYQAETSAHAPTFGNRRLDAPDTLKILDHGIKRRQRFQQKQADTDASSTTATMSSTTGNDETQATTLDGSRSCSTDEEKIDIPPDRPSNGFYHNTALRLFEGAVSATGSAPPSTSPYTDPLQSIPSQAALSLHQEESLPMPLRATSNYSRLPAINRRLSQLHTAHAAYTHTQSREDMPVPESTRNSLIELLNEYAREDRHLSREGLPGLDDDTKKHITCTLSLLEGRGSSPQSEVDNLTLLTLFGHLKRGLEKVPQPASLVKDAGTAEQYLAGAKDSNPERVEASGRDTNDDVKPDSHADVSQHGESRSRFPAVRTITSKWSSSTSSLKRASHTSEEKATTESAACSLNQPTQPSRPAPKAPPRSIGYPSRTAGKVSTPVGSIRRASGGASEKIQRESSPTLGKQRPGSVRVARETLQGRSKFGQTMSSAGSRKTATMPTPNTKPYSIGDGPHRGRVASAEKASAQSNVIKVPKTPRARSKSRYVFEKINGLFSGKRDKRATVVPPVPAIPKARTPDNRAIEVAPNGSPVLRPTRVPTMPKMPTLSSADHPALRSASRTSTTETPVDSVIAGEDSVAIQTWSESLIGRAQRETQTARKERLLNFAKVLNDSLINAREAQISAETAQHAARSAQLSYEMTQQSLAMLRRLAASMNTPSRQ